MRGQFLGRFVNLAMCSLLAVSGLHMGTWQIKASEAEYQNDYIAKYTDSITMEKKDGDNMLILNSLGSYAGDVTFEADVTLTNPDEQQSAALMFGITSNEINDATSIRANMHNKVDWTQPVRMWGSALEGELTCPGDVGSSNTWLSDNGVNVLETVHMKVSITGKNVTYSLNNLNKDEVTVGTATLKDGYTGGRLGIMTYASAAVFSNITVNGTVYGNIVKDGNGFTINGLHGDAHSVNESLGSIKAFTYEADVEMKAGQSAALTFGIKDKDQPGKNWFAANFDGQKARVFHVQEGNDVVGFGSNPDGEILGALDTTQPLHMKLDVDMEGNFKYYLYHQTAVTTTPVISGKLSDYTGGFVGALTFQASASFTNVVVTKQAEGLTDFSNVGTGKTDIDETDKRVTLSGADGNHFAIYNGLQKKANDFKLEADIDLQSGRSAALVFGIENKKTPGSKWYGANFDTKWDNPNGVMRVFGAGRDISQSAIADGMNFNKTVHLSIDVKKDGTFTYTFGNTGETLKSINGTIPDWKGGYAGLLTFDSEAAFSNISFDDRTDYTVVNNEVELTDAYHTNLDDLSYTNGTWEVRDGGLYSNAVNKGDSFLYTTSEGTNFVYSTDVKFHKQDGAAALVFRSTNDKENKNSYAVNIDGGDGSYKFWRWQDDSDYQLIDSRKVDKKETYHLEVVAYNGWISYYLDGQLVGNTGDYTIQNADLGQSTILEKGCFGLLNYNSEVSFQNTYYKEFNDSFTPLLDSLYISASKGTVEAAGQFVNTESVFMQYVSNDAETVNLNAVAKSSRAHLKAQSEDGTVYSDLQNIPVRVGKNIITLTSTIEADGRKATLTYRVIVMRRKASSSYYNEEYRGQYHYSVKEGWANDPNGLVYYNGKYHLFYQFYSDTTWGPMHWAHATSTDLIHWEEQPIAFYPDENGSMFSGCIVVDEHNTSGLFGDGNTGGLVALITANGNGQRIKLAYSTDEGKTWTKTNKIAADWSTDPLQSRDFRDPKVFRWENKWFMVVAGGPLRIYSSDNLTDWKVESTYKDLHTECPDLYPIQDSEGKTKWVLSRGGRYYKIGDFKEVAGNWKFVADSQYEGDNTEQDGIMNFGKDSYAAMTYYQQDFGTVQNPAIPELVELNWMNTWDYCRDVANLTGNDTFNGTFNLNLTLGLDNVDGKYVLTQKPITAYEQLRGDAVVNLKNADVTANNKLLKDFKGDSYEIVAKLKPGDKTTRVGFKVRTGNSQETVITYDINTKKLSIDRTKSGTILNDKFAEIDSQTVAKENSDGSVDLHIFVDKSSVEVFMNNYTTAGANQIFPTPTSLGAEVFSEGSDSKADIMIYPLQSVWNKETVTDIQKVGISKLNVDAYVDDTFRLTAYVMPVTASQDISWSVSDPSMVKVDANNGQADFTALKEGTVTITATSKKTPEMKADCKVVIRKNALKTNLKGFAKTANGWYIDGEKYVGSIGGDNGFIFAETKAESGVYTYSADIKLQKGIFNMILESKSNAFDGSYAIQLHGGGDTVRFFDFKGDKTFAEGKIKKSDTGEYHIDVTKDDKTVIIHINGEDVLQYTVEDSERQYTGGLFGFGIYNAEAEVTNIYVREGYPTAKILSKVTDLQLSDKQDEADAKKLLPETVRVERTNGMESTENIAWNLNHVTFKTPGSYELTGITESGLKMLVKVVVTTDKSVLVKDIKQIEALSKTGYTDTSWKALEKALANARNIMKKEFAKATEVQTAINDLKTSVDNLRKSALTVANKDKMAEIIGDLPENVILHMEDISNQIQSILNTNANVLFNVHHAYDINLLRNDQVFQLEGSMILRLKLDPSLLNEKIFIAYINDQGAADVLKTTIKDGYAQAKISHLSIYAIVTYKDTSSNDTENEKPEEVKPVKPGISDDQKMQETNDTPNVSKGKEISGSTEKAESTDTGDPTNTAAAMAVLMISAIGVCLLYRKRKHEN